MCLCVQFQETESCFHVKFIEEFGEKYFPFESGLGGMYTIVVGRLFLN
jgi:hypothetical protein